MTIRHIFWMGWPGQSNCWGINPGGSGSQTLAAVRYYACLIGTTPALTATLDDLNDTHGKDFEFGKYLNDRGWNIIIVNVCRGSTYANDWIPGGTYYTPGIAEVSRAWGLIQAAFPGDKFIHHHVTDQGEEDIRYPTSGVPSLWASNEAQSHSALLSTIGTTQMYTWVNQTNPNVTGATFPDLVNGLQLQAAGSASHYLVRSGFTYETGNLHMTTAGYIQNGQALGAMVLAGTPMGTLSTYSKNALLSHVTNKAAYTPAATHYAGAFISGVEVTGNGYARASATNNTTTWPNTVGRVKSSGAAFTFPAASGGDWGVVDEIRLFDASSGGNELARHTLSATQNVVNGGSPLTIASGAITVTWSTNVAVGGPTDAVVQGLSNLLFGGTAYSQLATVYFSYWAGDPAGAGAQAGSRTSVTQASSWNSASAAISTTSADITITDQATGTFFALHDANAAGNLLWSGPLGVTPPTGGKVAAGRLRLLIT
jgi:hypothetical protein